jgi:hypothetical protein
MNQIRKQSSHNSISTRPGNPERIGVDTSFASVGLVPNGVDISSLSPWNFRRNSTIAAERPSHIADGVSHQFANHQTRIVAA